MGKVISFSPRVPSPPQPPKRQPQPSRDQILQRAITRLRSLDAEQIVIAEIVIATIARVALQHGNDGAA